MTRQTMRKHRGLKRDNRRAFGKRRGDLGVNTNVLVLVGVRHQCRRREFTLPPNRFMG